MTEPKKRMAGKATREKLRQAGYIELADKPGLTLDEANVALREISATMQQERLKQIKELKASVRGPRPNVPDMTMERCSTAVVGESYRRSTLLAIFEAHRADVRHAYCWAVLSRDQSNRYDSNAVKIVIDGKHVGFLSQDDAESFAPYLDFCSSDLCCTAAVVGDHEEAWFGVYLDIDLREAASLIENSLEQQQKIKQEQVKAAIKRENENIIRLFKVMGAIGVIALLTFLTYYLLVDVILPAFGTAAKGIGAFGGNVIQCIGNLLDAFIRLFDNL